MERDEVFMRLALDEAREAAEEGEAPVGAVIVYEGKILCAGHNSRENALDISGHAEINAIRKAEELLGRWTLEGCTLYVTLEPCLMCAGAVKASRLTTLVYGASDPDEGAVKSKYHVFDADNGVPNILTGVMEAECSSVLKHFFLGRRKQNTANGKNR
ncbi:MAG: nucleoside deaminase [Bacilli bacterium]|nr:nucleoside deaminase [Bacilli bacterium]